MFVTSFIEIYYFASFLNNMQILSLWHSIHNGFYGCMVSPYITFTFSALLTFFKVETTVWYFQIHYVFAFYLNLNISRKKLATINNYWVRLSVISRIVKAEVAVICRSHRLRQITPTEALTILDITRKRNSIIILSFT